jgi:ABC-type multidrug transport system permease subunit
MDTGGLLLYIRRTRETMWIVAFVAGTMGVSVFLSFSMPSAELTAVEGLLQLAYLMGGSASVVLVGYVIRYYSLIKAAEMEILGRGDAFAANLIHQMHRAERRENAIGWAAVGLVLLVAGTLVLLPPGALLLNGAALIVIAAIGFGMSLKDAYSLHRMPA